MNLSLFKFALLEGDSKNLFYSKNGSSCIIILGCMMQGSSKFWRQLELLSVHNFLIGLLNLGELNYSYSS